MKTIDNKTIKLGDDFKQSLKPKTKIQMASSLFSMYGFELLKKELQNIDEMKFIFTDPTFVKNEGNKKEQRLFEINSLRREKSISGSEFEVKLKNNLNGKAIARECREWIENKVKFKTNINGGSISKFINIINEDPITYLNVEEFSSIGFGYERDNSLFSAINKIENAPEMTKYYIDSFNELWEDEKNLKEVTEDVIDFISNLYKENSPEFIYYVTLYNIFNEFLEDVTADELANEKVGFKESLIWNSLYDFQKDAVLGIINKLERHNGCILADSVGLGKTYSALGVIKYYQERNKSILVLCPKKLGNNWNTFLSNYKDNILQKDRFNYDVLYHTDLSRETGESNGIDLSRINWGNYDLVVIDESHNFRNNSARNDRETRYQRLLNHVMKTGVKTKVLMLSATPVNNKFLDLKNQLALAYEGKTDEIDSKINPTKSIDIILKNAQKSFNDWSKLSVENRTAEELLKALNINFDFFKLLDSVTIARSRKHIEKYYDINKIGKFPTRLKPISIFSELTDIEDSLSIKEIYLSLSKLNMSVYSPFNYILPAKMNYYSEIYDTKVQGDRVSLKQSDRERSLQVLMRINLLKRLESSVDSFRLTLDKILLLIENTLKAIENYENHGIEMKFDNIDFDNINTDDDIEEILSENFSIGNKIKISLSDMNTLGWRADLVEDYQVLKTLLYEMKKITPDKDTKLNELVATIENKINNPINGDNKKILIFSAYADTAKYLYNNLSQKLKNNYNLETALLTGSDINSCTLKIRTDFNNLLMNFSPISKQRNLLEPGIKDEIDILIATDCISEGQNLQDCDYLINYDIHWNPVRIIQRFGRIDRIGSKNDVIQLVNFWPNLKLDDYINLKNRVENRMLILDATATGEDNVLTNESNDMEYRKEQLKRLQEEVVDIEEMGTGISITDLGLNDFRMDLVNYINENGSLEKVPTGMHSVVRSNESLGIDKGVIYVLRNINSDVNINNSNQLHPFYLVYIKENGEILSNHLDVKRTLDILRLVSKGKNEPIKDCYMQFNKLTEDGKKMTNYSNLLNEAISSIISVKEESDIDSLFTSGGTTVLQNDIKGLDDFELVSFMVVI